MDIPEDENRGPTLATIIWVANSVALVFVLCRLYTRLLVTRSPWIDDIIIIVSISLSLISASVITAAIPIGMGRHLRYIEPSKLTRVLKLNAIAQPFQIMAFSVPKISVAVLLVRMMGTAKRGIWFLGTLTLSLNVLTALNAIFVFAQCKPADAAWDGRDKATCWSPEVFTDYSIVVGVYSAICDFCLAIFPITIFWKLQLRLKKKIGICCVMGLGVFAGICSIVKITTLAGLEVHADITWATVDLFAWTSVEISVIIICACVPTLAPLVQICFGKRNSTHHRISENVFVMSPLSGATSATLKKNGLDDLDVV